MNLNKTTYGKINAYDQLKVLRNQNKRQESTSKKQGNNRTGSWNGTQNRKVENLLEIIDSYKSKLLLAEQ